MATIPQTSAEAEVLIARLAAARATLSDEAIILRDRLSIQRRVKKSIFLKPLVWLGGCTAAGLLVSLILPRHTKTEKPKAKKKRSIAGFLIASAFSLARPFLQKHAMAFITNRLLALSAPTQSARLHDRNVIEV